MNDDLDNADVKSGPKRRAGARPPLPSLTARVLKSIGWVFAGRAFGRVIQLVRVIVLARLLMPEDFGLFGIVMLAIATLETFSQIGFQTALIQRKENTDAYLDTAWTVQVIRGLVLAAILFAAAPAVAWFFEVPRAAVLLRVMCISVVLGGFVNIGIIYFQKDLEFHKQALFNVADAGVSLIVGIFLAYQLRSVWALVWAGIAGAVTRCVVSHLMVPYRPALHLRKDQFVELFRFGRWMLGSSVVVFLATRGDHAFLAKMLGAGALGLYQMAYSLSNMPATQITYLTSQVMMPAYAKVQDNRSKLGGAFLDVFEVVLSLAMPLAVFIALAGREIILGVLGPNWEAAVVPVQILAVAGLLRAVQGTAGPLFVGAGRPHMNFFMNVVRFGAIVCTIYPLTKLFGIAGTSLSVVFALTATLPLWAKARSIAGISWSQLLSRCKSAVLLSSFVAVGIGLVKLLPIVSVRDLLVCEFIGCAVLGIGATWLSGRWFHSRLSMYALQAWAALRTT